MFAKIKDSEVLVFPYTINTLQEENPHTNFGFFTEENLPELYSTTEDAVQSGASIVNVEVDSTSDFLIESKKYVLDETPLLVNGVWKVQKRIQDLSGEELEQGKELAKARILSKVQQSIVDNSWTLSQSSGLSAEKRDEWAAYFAALNTIQSQEGFPFDFIYPSKPE
jgi:hypothetical protein